MSFDLIDKKFRPAAPIALECFRCGTTAGVEMENSRTAYHYEGKTGDVNDPNNPIPFCRACAKDHHEYWDGMWAEYNAGRL